MAAPTRLTMIRLTTTMRRPPSVNASTRSPTCTVCAGLTLTSLMLTCPARHAADANERVRMEHVQKGYRADRFSQVETLVFMAFYERACAEYCRNLADKTDEPVLKGLIGRIAGDEERHEEFFANLVTHCLDFAPEETVAAIAARAAELKVVGAEIDAYADRQAGIAEAGIFGPDQLRRVISDRISAWGLAANPDLKGFAIS